MGRNKEVNNMCTVLEKLKEDGKMEGIEEKDRKEGIVSSMKNLMDTMGWSAEQAMKALKISKEEQESGYYGKKDFRRISKGCSSYFPKFC